MEPSDVVILQAMIAARTQVDQESLIAALPLLRAIDIIIAFEQLHVGNGYELLNKLLWPLAKQLDNTAGAWATSTANRLTTQIKTSNAKLRAVVALTVLLGLARANIAFDDNWRALFTMWDLQVAVGAEVDEILNALSVEQRELALLAIAGAASFETAQVQNAMSLLRKWPSAVLVHAVLKWLPKAFRSENVKPQLKLLAMTSPVVAAALKDAKKRTAVVARLWMCDLESINRLPQLDDVGQAQLVQAQLEYGGLKMTAAAIMATDNADLDGRICRDFLERGGIVDATGTRLYDFWLYGDDAGTFFHAGSTNVAAGLVQGSVDGGDTTLRDALTLALRSPPTKKAPTKKAPTKKAPTKKAPTKKAPTKKAPTKKVVTPGNPKAK